ncbi:MAG: DMT family transporter [Bacteroidales bacterium]|jgi:transporter family protein|nr:DMT family transporter [Bacteroidales bacterium]
MWIFLALLSAILLGVYDILKKFSLRDNPVFLVLLISTFTGALIFLPAVVMSGLFPEYAVQQFWYIAPANIRTHGLIGVKSCIVGASWVLSYYAVKYLPLTIVSPIRSTGPLWTLIGALVIFGERLNPLQWVGLAASLTCFWLFSQAGRKEGFSFRNNRWIWCIYAGTLLGSISGLYDKYLLAHYDRMVVQAYFSLYLVPVILPFVLFKWLPSRKQQPLHWRYTIPLIGICLTLADYVYFYALSFPDSLVSIVSTVRRCSVVVPFLAGTILLHEKNIRRKALCLLGMLIGIGIIIWGSK